MNHFNYFYISDDIMGKIWTKPVTVSMLHESKMLLTCNNCCSIVIVECLRPASPRLYFSDRVEFVPDQVESKILSDPSTISLYFNTQLDNITMVLKPKITTVSNIIWTQFFSECHRDTKIHFHQVVMNTT